MATGPATNTDEVIPAGSLLGRYRILQPLGTGGVGVVYAAFDTELDTKVALKILRRQHPRSIAAFKREFRSLAGVRHRNLIKLHDLAVLDQRWFFTMELVRGRDFFLHVRDHHDPSFSLLRETLPQLAAGLSALHDAGKLHRDVKPSNVFVTHSGRVVLLDFGLATSLERPKANDDEGVVFGTVGYVSPELVSGGTPTPAADWYSVGVMLYKALTGELPFRGSASDILTAKQTMDPKPPASGAVGVPEDLSHLCMALLARSPEDRPDGDEILSRLGAPQKRRRAKTSGVPFIGRPEYTDALEEAFRMSRAGTPVTMHMYGPSGVGKSSLVSQFCAQAESTGEALVLFGRCYEHESVPYKGLDAAVEQLSHRLKELSAGDIGDTIPEDVAFLARLFPAFQWLSKLVRETGPPPELAASHEQRQRAFECLRKLVTNVAARTPIILALDDVQWGDVDMAALLSELMRGPRPPAILLLLAYRDDETNTSEALQTFSGPGCPIALRNRGTPTRPGAVQVHGLEVSSLAPQAATELALVLLSGGGERAIRQARAIQLESGGNPYFIGELARFINEGENLVTDPDERPPTSPPSLDQLIIGRVHELADSAR